MASTSPSPDPSKSPPPEDEGVDEEPSDQPLTMTASVVLSALPKTASEALQGAGDLPVDKITIMFLPVGSAPSLKRRVFKISTNRRFLYVVTFLRGKLGVNPKDSVFCYVNSIFSPGLDEEVGNLWRVIYSLTWNVLLLIKL